MIAHAESLDELYQASHLPDAMHILVVDDDSMDARGLVRHLKSAFVVPNSMEVRTDFTAAIDALKSQHFDFIFVDEGLGGRSGLELIQWLRKQSDPPVAILITGDDTPELEERAIDAGAWHFIPKPELSPGLLRRTMRFAWSQSLQERALQMSRQAVADKTFISATLDAAFAGILTVSRSGHILLANRSARQLLRLEENVVKQGWPVSAQLIDPETFFLRPHDQNPIARISAGDPPQGEVVLLKTPRERSLKYLRISGQMVPGVGEDDLGVLLLQDVTDQEQNRERAERAGRLEALGQMTGGIAHDFNNILATVLSSAEVAQLMPEQSENSLAVIVKSAQRGAELTNQLLTFARPSRSPHEIVDVAKFLTAIRELALRTMTADNARNIDVVLDEVDPTLALVCSPSDLEHALLNLIINARDAIAMVGHSVTANPENANSIKDASSPPTAKGVIGLSARPLTGQQIDKAGRLIGVSGMADANYVEITVSDNGPGMPEHIRRRAIDPFFTTKPLQAGSGLGLALVTSFVDKLGGTFRIYSDEGHGTTVRLMLPVADNAASMVTTRVQEDAAPRGRGQRILVVEDEDDLRSMTCALLNSLGYQTMWSSNADEALMRLKDGLEVDALLTDIIMPGGLNGLELVAELEKRGFDKPIAIMSGYAGADQPSNNKPFIQKPCSHAEMATLMAGLFID